MTKNLPIDTEVHRQLKILAEADHRPLKSEMAWLVEQETKRRAAQPEGDWALAGDIPGRVER